MRLADDPYDDTLWAAFAKELAAADDTRAPHLEKELAGAEGSVRALVEGDPEKWLGMTGYDPADPDPGFLFEWRHGFVVGLAVDLRPGVLKWPSLVDRFAALVDSPAARLLRRIELRRVEGKTDGRHYLAPLVARPRPALRELTAKAWTVKGFDANAFPSLERLTVRDANEIEPMSLPRLRELDIDSDKLSKGALRGLASSKLPALASLRIAVRHWDVLSPKERPTARDLGAALSAHHALRSVAVGGKGFDARELIETIAGSPIAASIESLDLSALDLTHDARAALRDAALRFVALNTLVLTARDLGSDPQATFGALAARATPAVPTPREVAAHAAALVAECTARAFEFAATQEGHRAAVDARRWASHTFFETHAATAQTAAAAAAGALAWSLGWTDALDIDLEVLARRIPIGSSLDALANGATLRARGEIALACDEAQRETRRAWLAFEDTSSHRERLRALRWLLGAARRWTEVPTHVPATDLPLPPQPSNEVSKRLSKVWRQLSKRYAEPKPEPLAEEIVDDAEREIGGRFPPDLRASLLLHGGGPVPGIELASLEGAREVWRSWDANTSWEEEKAYVRHEDAHPSLVALREGSWRRTWFPITDPEGSSDLYAVDLDPAPGGVVGQVFYWSHDIPGPERVVCNSFLEWLEWAVTAEELAPFDD